MLQIDIVNTDVTFQASSLESPLYSNKSNQS